MVKNVTETVVGSKEDLFKNEQLFLEKVAKMLGNGEISMISYNMLMNLYTAKLNLVSQSDIMIRVYDGYRRDNDIKKLKFLKNVVEKSLNFDKGRLLVDNLLEVYETGKVNMEVRSVLLRLMAYVDMPINVDTYDDAEVVDYTFGKIVKDVINGNFHDYFMDKNNDKKVRRSRIRK